jgi:hypothetical protein
MWVPQHVKHICCLAPPLLCAQENQNEVVTVASVSEDGRTIFLTAPLQYQHYGWVRTEWAGIQVCHIACGYSTDIRGHPGAKDTQHTRIACNRGFNML